MEKQQTKDAREVNLDDLVLRALRVYQNEIPEGGDEKGITKSDIDRICEGFNFGDFTVGKSETDENVTPKSNEG